MWGRSLGLTWAFYVLFEGLNGGWYYGLYFLSRIFDSYVIKDGIERNSRKFINLEKSCLVLTLYDKTI